MIARKSSRASDSSAGKMRFAIPKGALLADSVALLEAAGIEVGSLADPGRKLIIETDEFDFIIGKPSDIPIYVASGAADIGIAGKDVLLELDLDVVEMVDLGFGGCRFVVAEPEDAHASIEEQYAHLGVIRVATKYPHVTEAHFAAKGMQVEIVKLNGNIEIAPLIGIAEQVVDITQTGTTLRKNNLRIVEEVSPSTARFIANPAALRTLGRRVTDMANDLAAVVADGATDAPVEDG